MRILISAKWLGGIGGAERAVTSWILALGQHDVDVCATRVIDSEFLIIPSNVSVISKWRYHRSTEVLERLARAVTRTPAPPAHQYDVYIHFWHGEYVADRFSCRLRLLSPAGSPTQPLEDKFDFVMSESPGGYILVRDEQKHVVVAPPVAPMAQHSAEIPWIPREFLLTVFNPHSPTLKGTNVLLEIAEAAPHPIIWCHSMNTDRVDARVHQHPNIIHVESATQAQLRYLYESCRAYVSFSRSEGFGWAIADALLYQRPIVSRQVGVLTFYAEQPGLSYYQSIDELRRVLVADVYEAPTYDLSPINPSRAVCALERLVQAERP